jgi:thioredoxin reductase
MRQRLSIDIIDKDPLIEVVDKRPESHSINLLTKSGKLYNTDVIFYHVGYKVQTQLAKELGCHLEEGFIKINNKQETTVAKVYAAGDVDTDRHYVVLAVASGLELNTGRWLLYPLSSSKVSSLVHHL